MRCARARRDSFALAIVLLTALESHKSSAAPVSESTEIDTYDEGAGCYYNFQHYGEGDRIMTNEPCLNCTCHNRMLMCYLRVCPFTKPIGQDCTVEKRGDQCCPIITCPDVPVDLIDSTTQSTVDSTEVGHHDNFGCSIDNRFYSDGAQVPSNPEKPCELCYCIRNMTACVMQECTLHVEGCTPVYQRGLCCPVRYSCDHPEDEGPLMIDDATTTVKPTPGFILTTTVQPGFTMECTHNDEVYADGALIPTEQACEHCYCMKGDIVCAVQECGTPMENEGKNCTAILPKEGQCCPDTYVCEGEDITSTTLADVNVQATISSLLEGEHFGHVSSEKTKDQSDHSTEPTKDVEKLLIKEKQKETKPQDEIVATLPTTDEPNEVTEHADQEKEDSKESIPDEQMVEHHLPSEKIPQHRDDISAEYSPEDDKTSHVTETNNIEHISTEKQKTTDDSQQGIEIDAVNKDVTDESKTETVLQEEVTTVPSVINKVVTEIPDELSHTQVILDSITEKQDKTTQTPHTEVQQTKEETRHTTSIPDLIDHHEKEDVPSQEIESTDDESHKSTDAPESLDQHIQTTKDELSHTTNIPDIVDPEKESIPLEDEEKIKDEMAHTTVIPVLMDHLDHEKEELPSYEVQHTENEIGHTTNIPEKPLDNEKEDKLEPDQEKYPLEKMKPQTDEDSSLEKTTPTTLKPNLSEENLAITKFESHAINSENTPSPDMTTHSFIQDTHSTENQLKDVESENVNKQKTDKTDDSQLSEKDRVEQDQSTAIPQIHEQHTTYPETNLTISDKDEKVESDSPPKEDEIKDSEAHSVLESSGDGYEDMYQQTTVRVSEEKYSEKDQKQDTILSLNKPIKRVEDDLTAEKPELTIPSESFADTGSGDGLIKEDVESSSVKSEHITETNKDIEVSTEYSDKKQDTTTHISQDKTTDHIDHETKTPITEIPDIESSTVFDEQKSAEDSVPIKESQTVSTTDKIDSSLGTSKFDSEITTQKIAETTSLLFETKYENEKGQGESIVSDTTTKLEEQTVIPEKDTDTQEEVTLVPKDTLDLSTSIGDNDEINPDENTSSHDVSLSEDEMIHYTTPVHRLSDSETEKHEETQTQISQEHAIETPDKDIEKSDDKLIVDVEQHSTTITSISEQTEVSEDKIEHEIQPSTIKANEILEEKTTISPSNPPVDAMDADNKHPSKQDKISTISQQDVELTTPLSSMNEIHPEQKPIEEIDSINIRNEVTNDITTSLNQEQVTEAFDKHTIKPEEITTAKISELATSEVHDELENEIIDDHKYPEINNEPSRIPGEGDCLIDGVTYKNYAQIPTINKCQTSCRCLNSVLKCEHVTCSPPPSNMINCQAVYHAKDTCCPMYTCEHEETGTIESDNQMSDVTTSRVENVHITDLDENQPTKDVIQSTEKYPDHQIIEEEPIIPEVYKPDCGSNGCEIIKPKPSETEHTTIHSLHDDINHIHTQISNEEQSTTASDISYTTPEELHTFSSKDEGIEQSSDKIDQSNIDSNVTPTHAVIENVTEDIKHSTSEISPENEKPGKETLVESNEDVMTSTILSIQTEDQKSETPTEKTVEIPQDHVNKEKPSEESIGDVDEIKTVTKEHEDFDKVSTEKPTQEIVSESVSPSNDLFTLRPTFDSDSTRGPVDIESEIIKSTDKPIDANEGSTKRFDDKTLQGDVIKHDEKSTIVYETSTVSLDDVNKIGVSVLPTDSVDDITQEKTKPIEPCDHLGCQVEAHYTRHPIDATTTEKPVHSKCESENCIDGTHIPEKIDENECGETGCDTDEQNIISDDIEKPICGPNGCISDDKLQTPLGVSVTEKTTKLTDETKPILIDEHHIDQVTNEKDDERVTEMPGCNDESCKSDTDTELKLTTIGVDSEITVDAIQSTSTPHDNLPDVTKSHKEEPEENIPHIEKHETDTKPENICTSDDCKDNVISNIDTSSKATPSDGSNNEMCDGVECSIKSDSTTESHIEISTIHVIEDTHIEDQEQIQENIPSDHIQETTDSQVTLLTERKTTIMGEFISTTPGSHQTSEKQPEHVEKVPHTTNIPVTEKEESQYTNTESIKSAEKIGSEDNDSGRDQTTISDKPSKETESDTSPGLIYTTEYSTNLKETLSPESHIIEKDYAVVEHDTTTTIKTIDDTYNHDEEENQINEEENDLQKVTTLKVDITTESIKSHSDDKLHISSGEMSEPSVHLLNENIETTVRTDNVNIVPPSQITIDDKIIPKDEEELSLTTIKSVPIDSGTPVKDNDIVISSSVADQTTEAEDTHPIYNEVSTDKIHKITESSEQNEIKDTHTLTPEIEESFTSQYDYTKVQEKPLDSENQTSFEEIQPHVTKATQPETQHTTIKSDIDSETHDLTEQINEILPSIAESEVNKIPVSVVPSIKDEDVSHIPEKDTGTSTDQLNKHTTEITITTESGQRIGEEVDHTTPHTDLKTTVTQDETPIVEKDDEESISASTSRPIEKDIIHDVTESDNDVITQKPVSQVENGHDNGLDEDAKIPIDLQTTHKYDLSIEEDVKETTTLADSDNTHSSVFKEKVTHTAVQDIDDDNKVSDEIPMQTTERVKIDQSHTYVEEDHITTVVENEDESIFMTEKSEKQTPAVIDLEDTKTTSDNLLEHDHTQSIIESEKVDKDEIGHTTVSSKQHVEENQERTTIKIDQEEIKPVDEVQVHEETTKIPLVTEEYTSHTTIVSDTSIQETTDKAIRDQIEEEVTEQAIIVTDHIGGDIDHSTVSYEKGGIKPDSQIKDEVITHVEKEHEQVTTILPSNEENSSTDISLHTTKESTEKISSKLPENELIHLINKEHTTGLNEDEKISQTTEHISQTQDSFIIDEKLEDESLHVITDTKTDKPQDHTEKTETLHTTLDDLKDKIKVSSDQGIKEDSHSTISSLVDKNESPTEAYESHIKETTIDDSLKEYSTAVPQKEETELTEHTSPEDIEITKVPYIITTVTEQNVSPVQEEKKPVDEDAHMQTVYTSTEEPAKETIESDDVQTSVGIKEVEVKTGTVGQVESAHTTVSSDKVDIETTSIHSHKPEVVTEISSKNPIDEAISDHTTVSSDNVDIETTLIHRHKPEVAAEISSEHPTDEAASAHTTVSSNKVDIETTSIHSHIPEVVTEISSEHPTDEAASAHTTVSSDKVDIETTSIHSHIPEVVTEISSENPIDEAISDHTTVSSDNVDIETTLIHRQKPEVAAEISSEHPTDEAASAHTTVSSDKVDIETTSIHSHIPEVVTEISSEHPTDEAASAHTTVSSDKVDIETTSIHSHIPEVVTEISSENPIVDAISDHTTVSSDNVDIETTLIHRHKPEVVAEVSSENPTDEAESAHTTVHSDKVETETTPIYSHKPDATESPIKNQTEEADKHEYAEEISNVSLSTSKPEEISHTPSISEKDEGKDHTTISAIKDESLITSDHLDKETDQQTMKPADTESHPSIDIHTDTVLEKDDTDIETSTHISLDKHVPSKPDQEESSEIETDQHQKPEKIPDHGLEQTSIIDRQPDTTIKPHTEETKLPHQSSTDLIHEYITSKLPFIDLTTMSPFHEKHQTTVHPDSEEADIGQAEIPALPSPDEDEDHQEPQTPDFPGFYGTDTDYEEGDQTFGPGTCRYGGKVFVSAQQIPRDDPCDFCFCFRSDIICLQQSCPPPIQHCHEEPIQGFCCPRYECPVSMAVTMNVTTTTTTTTTTLPPHFLSHAYKGKAQRQGCLINGQAYQVGEDIKQTSGPCLQCKCGSNGQMKCDPKVCTPEPMLRQMIAVAATQRRR